MRHFSQKKQLKHSFLMETTEIFISYKTINFNIILTFVDFVVGFFHGCKLTTSGGATSTSFSINNESGFRSSCVTTFWFKRKKKLRRQLITNNIYSNFQVFFPKIYTFILHNISIEFLCLSSLSTVSRVPLHFSQWKYSSLSLTMCMASSAEYL